MAGPSGGVLAVGAGGGHSGGLLGQARGRPCGPPFQPDLPGRLPGGADLGCVGSAMKLAALAVCVCRRGHSPAWLLPHVGHNHKSYILLPSSPNSMLVKQHLNPEPQAPVPEHPSRGSLPLSPARNASHSRNRRHRSHKSHLPGLTSCDHMQAAPHQEAPPHCQPSRQQGTSRTRAP